MVTAGSPADKARPTPTAHKPSCRQVWDNNGEYRIPHGMHTYSSQCLPAICMAGYQYPIATRLVIIYTRGKPHCGARLSHSHTRYKYTRYIRVSHPLKVCYICSGITGADLLAYDLYEAAKKYLAGQKIRLFNGPKEPDFESNLYLLKHTKCPAVLTENLFQDCLSDVSFLQSHSGMKAITMLHIEGIIEYLERTV